MHTMEPSCDQFTQVSQEREMFKRQFITLQKHYENKIQELSVLKELGNLLRSEIVFDQSELWQKQINIIKQYTSIDTIAILLLEDDGKKLALKAGSGNPDKYSIVLGTIIEDRIHHQVFIKRQPVKIDTINGKPITQAFGHKFTGSLLYLPITHNDRTIGVLSLLHNKEHWFDQNKVYFLEIVAGKIATSIGIFRLYHKMLKEEKHRTLLSRFFSQNVTEKIYYSDGHLQRRGERKKVTVLFADLCGFTAMSEELNQEMVFEILNAYFSVMTPVIFKHNGTLDKLMGDGMLVLFGAPITHEADALQAVWSAVEMIKALGKFNRSNKGKGWPKLSVSIGINTGNVAAGYVGSEEHLNYTAIGDAVNVAQRIQTIAGGDEILISKTVYDEIIDKAPEVSEIKGFIKIPPRKVKGKKKPIDLYRIELTDGNVLPFKTQDLLLQS